MPRATSYPGVYIEELSSGVRTITGVPTAITAFVGRAQRGPTDTAKGSPVLVNSFAEFERLFGGLWIESSLSFAVRDFFLNGGTQALIVRLFHKNAGHDCAQLAINGLALKAAWPGQWGNRLSVAVDHDVKSQPGTNRPDPDLFNLIITDQGTGTVETLRNVSHLATRIERVDKVLETRSELAHVVSLPSARPAAGTSTVETEGQATDGDPLVEADFIGPGKEEAMEGLFALLKADLFNLLCIPPYNTANNADAGVISAAARLCEKKRAFLIVDPLASWNSQSGPKVDFSAVLGTDSRNAALFFPRLLQPNPLRNNQREPFAPCGAVAGIFARTDAERGVWKAPAGLAASLAGSPAVTVPLTDPENDELNQLGVNCLRTMPGAGCVVWGSRTLRGNDRLASDWNYISIRRLALYLEESLYRGTQWAVFERNDEPLWAQLRQMVGAFMHNLFRQGAFPSQTPREAYFVKCDRETTTQNDANLGIINIIIGFAPLKPAEFVILKFQQKTGQIET